MPALTAPAGATTLYAFEEIWPLSARNSTLPKLSARQDFWQFGGIKPTANPAPAPLGEYDQWVVRWAKGAPIAQRDFWPNGFIKSASVPGTPGMWSFAAIGHLAIGQAEFVTGPTAQTPSALGEFDQWAATQRRKLALSDFTSFEQAPPSAALGEFDQWAASTRRKLASGDFASFVGKPFAQVLAEFDRWWQQSKTPLAAGQDFTGFVFNPPAGVAQPLRQFDRWEPTWNKGVPVPQRTQFWDFARIDQPPALAAQSLKQFDSWSSPRTTTQAGKDFTSFVGTPPTTTTTTAIDPFVWVKRKKKPLPPVIIDGRKRRKQEQEDAPLPEPIPELLPEPLVSPHTLIPLPPATLPDHIFKAPQWALPQLSTSPPPLPTQDEIDAEDAMIMAMLEHEDHANMDGFGELMDLIKNMRGQA